MNITTNNDTSRTDKFDHTFGKKDDTKLILIEDSKGI